MKAKSTKEILKICDENDGKILSAQEILKLFGYSKKSTINRLKVTKFLLHDKYKHPSSYWKIKIWVLLAPKQLAEVEPESPFFNPCIRRVSPFGLFIYHKDKVPWWMLKEYGGKL